MTTYPALELGQLPVELINATIGTDLIPGIVRLSSAAHRHMAKDHSADYAICRAALREAITIPTFIGQDPSHSRNLVIVKRVGWADGRAVLVAIGLEIGIGATYPFEPVI